MRSLEELRPIKQNDLTGFQFGEYHSSQFGLVRVSSGNRYSEYLSPTFKNQTTEATGMDGTLFFGRNNNSRSFSVDLAFDGVTESELRDIKEWLNNGVQPLIFDERPYIQYFCTLNAAPQIKYLTFYEKDVRIYKGEISLNFISYYPYGFSIDGKKFADDFSDDNFEEWSGASGLVNRAFYDSASIERYYDTAFQLSSSDNYWQLYTYNNGDFDSDFVISFNYTAAAATTCTIADITDEDESSSLVFSLSAGEDITVEYNSKLDILKIDEVVENSQISTKTFNKLAQGRRLIKITTPNATMSDISITYKNKFL